MVASKFSSELSLWLDTAPIASDITRDLLARDCKILVIRQDILR